jgi:hypothetical protein
LLEPARCDGSKEPHVQVERSKLERRRIVRDPLDGSGRFRPRYLTTVNDRRRLASSGPRTTTRRTVWMQMNY